MIISFIGYRGTGKSSLAPLLAKRLKSTFVDSDRVIEERTGRSIKSIFADQGEAAFRQLEAEVLADLFQRDQLVIATGGGAILNPQTRRLMKEAGPVFWLKADLDTLTQRLSADANTDATRPSLTSLPAAAEIEKVLADRTPLYRDTCHFEVDTTGRTFPDILKEILQKLEEESPEFLKRRAEHVD